MNILITGGCGFLGSNLAAHGIQNGHSIVVFDNLSRVGSEQNKRWLDSVGAYEFVRGNTFDRDAVDSVIRDGQFDAIFHLAGQVAMTISIADPYRDFCTNALGTVHVLDAVRRYSPNTAVLYSSTNKVYGDLEEFRYEETQTRYRCLDHPNGFTEEVRLDFRSPYGCSKGSADQYMLDFARTYQLKTVVFRHSSMYGSRQFATYDQGWVGWFCKMALAQAADRDAAPFTISGNGKQVRDILHADDMIRLYYTALAEIDCIAGEAFNIGGGMDQSLSLLELFALLEEILQVKLRYTVLPPRMSDQKVFVADISKINRMTGWAPEVGAREGIRNMLEWVKRQ